MSWPDVHPPVVHCPFGLRRHWSFLALVGAVGLGVVMGGLGTPGALVAQGWVADVQAARSSFGTPPLNAVSTNASVGLRFTRDRRYLHGAGALPLREGDLAWGFLSVGDRVSLRRGRFEVGVDPSVLAHAQRDPSTDLGGSGLRAELLPVVSASVGSVVTEVRSGGSWYRGRIGEESWTRDLHVTDVVVSQPRALASGRTLRVDADLRHLRAGGGVEGGEEAYTWAGILVSGGAGRASWWASSGRWVAGLDDEAAKTALGGGVSWALAASTALSVAVRREPFDPVFLGTDRTSWGVALRHRLGAAPPRPPGAGVDVRRMGRIVVRLPLDASPHPPGVAGDFTNWEVRAMHRRGHHWEAEFDVRPGLYHYAFRSRDGDWFVPPGVEGRRQDGMGGWVAVLLVPEVAR